MATATLNENNCGKIDSKTLTVFQNDTKNRATAEKLLLTHMQSPCEAEITMDVILAFATQSIQKPLFR